VVNEIEPKQLKARLDAGEDIVIVDVREDWELRQSKVARAMHIPMDDIPAALDRIPKDKPVVIMCHVGERSAQVVYWLRYKGYTNVYSLEGGISRWAREVDPSVRRQ
jgi:rhodanese-related sulfurtransferase